MSGRATVALIYSVLCILTLIEPALASDKGSTYRDPQHRFSLFVPSGWKLRPLSDSVQVVRGDAYLTVLIFGHSSDPESLVGNLSRQISNKWKQPSQVAYGQSTVAGLKAATATLHGINPDGVEAVLQLAGVSENETAYVLVISSPKSDLPKLQGTLSHIAASFRVSSNPVEKPETRPTLGVDVTDLSSEDAKAYGLAEPTGAMVIQIAENGPAAKAGVQLHDVIVTCAGQTIDSAAMLQQVIAFHHAGDDVDLELLRAADNKLERLTLKAQLATE